MTPDDTHDTSPHDYREYEPECPRCARPLRVCEAERLRLRYGRRTDDMSGDDLLAEARAGSTARAGLDIPVEPAKLVDDMLRHVFGSPADAPADAQADATAAPSTPSEPPMALKTLMQAFRGMKFPKPLKITWGPESTAFTVDFDEVRLSYSEDDMMYTVQMARGPRLRFDCQLKLLRGLAPILDVTL